MNQQVLTKALFRSKSRMDRFQQFFEKNAAHLFAHGLRANTQRLHVFKLKRRFRWAGGRLLAALLFRIRSRRTALLRKEISNAAFLYLSQNKREAIHQPAFNLNLCRIMNTERFNRFQNIFLQKYFTMIKNEAFQRIQAGNHSHWASTSVVNMNRRLNKIFQFNEKHSAFQNLITDKRVVPVSLYSEKNNFERVSEETQKKARLVKEKHETNTQTEKRELQVQRHFRDYPQLHHSHYSQQQISVELTSLISQVKNLIAGVHSTDRWQEIITAKEKEGVRSEKSMDELHLADHVCRLIEKRMKIERERSGQWY